MAALIIGLSLGRRLILWLLNGLLIEWRPIPGLHVMIPSPAAGLKRPHGQDPEFCDSRLPSSRWCSLAAAASPPQPSSLLEENGADRDIPLPLPRAEVRQHLEEYGIDVLKV
eukprot:EG_transcript_57256